MATFIDTVDAIGDEATTKAILEGTITEYIDTKIKRIGSGAFRYVGSLKTVIIPNCEEIHGSAFTNSGLKTLYIGRNCTLLGNAFSSSGMTQADGRIYVPDDLVDTYKAATYWSTFASKIVGWSEYPDN